MDVKTITKAELTSALEHTSIHLGEHSAHVGKATYPDALTNDLFRYIEGHREPKYVSGEIYKDAYDQLWMFSSIGQCWYAFGTTQSYPFDRPKRPLRKMVPEGER